MGRRKVIVTIELDEPLSAALDVEARRRGIEPGALAVRLLREHVPPLPIEPRDEWERSLLAQARDYGVSLSDEALSREHMYD